MGVLFFSYSLWQTTKEGLKLQKLDAENLLNVYRNLQFFHVNKKEILLSPSGKGRKRALEDPIENLDTKRVKYSHNYDVEEEEDENEDEITFQDSILKNRDPTKSTRRTITEAFSATGITPSNNSSTDSLLRQILARLELLKQQHKETERQIQYIIEESETNPDLFIIQQAKISQTETERNATLSGELLFNLKAFSSLLQRD